MGGATFVFESVRPTDLGFWRVESSDEEGWAVVTNGELRLGLFEPQFMNTDFSLNFRGGDVGSISEALSSKGHVITKGPKVSDSGGSASMVDPDGHAIFFDSILSETKRVVPME